MEYIIHNVIDDDSFERLAQRYNTTIQAILDTHNKIAKPAVPFVLETVIHPKNKAIMPNEVYIPIVKKTSEGQAYVINYIEKAIVQIDTTARYYNLSESEIIAFHKKMTGEILGSSVIDRRIYVPIKMHTFEEKQENASLENTNGNRGSCIPPIKDDNEQNANSSTTVIACTEDQFIVQVMGKEHPDAQRVILVDDKNTVIVADSKEVIVETEQTLLSTLHKWEWSKLEPKKDKLKAYLEISNTNGQPIRLLLSEKINKTEKQLDKQHNQIVPFIPTSLVGRASDFNYSADGATFIRNMGAPVIARPGYLYVFKGNTLIREVEIIAKDHSTMVFKDIPIEQHRKLNIFNDGFRKSTGAELTEIWMASCWNAKDIGNISFMYSEVQLSAARLNLFTVEQSVFASHPKTLPEQLSVEKATHKILEKDILKGDALLGNFSYINVSSNLTSPSRNATQARKTLETLKTEVISANLIAPHRMRDVILEVTLDQPAKYLYDEKEEYFKKSLELANKFEDENQKGKATFFTLTGNQYQVNKKIRDLEFTAWAQIVEERKQFMKSFVETIGKGISWLTPFANKKEAPVVVAAPPSSKDEVATLKTFDTIKTPISPILQSIIDIVSNDGKAEKPTAPPNLWTNSPAFNNVLQDAQNRHIYTIQVEDVIYQSRHLVTNITKTNEQLKILADQAARQPYFDSALIIQQVVAPEILGGKPNELRDTLKDKLDQEGKQKLSIASSATGRAALVTKYAELQTKLCNQYRTPELQEILADHLSQENELHYTAAYINTLRSLTSFALPVSQIDPYLSPDGGVYYGIQKLAQATNQEQGLKFLTEQVEALDTQLHKMLFKPIDTEIVGKPLTEKDTTKVTKNFGNGYVRPNILHNTLNDKKEATEEDKKNLDAALIVLEVKYEEDKNKEIKALMDLGKSLTGIMSSAFSNIQSLVQHWSQKETIEKENNASVRSSIQEIEKERTRLDNQKIAIENAQKEITAKQNTPVISETLTLAEETSQNSTEALKEIQQKINEINSGLPKISEDANSAKTIQTLEADQVEHQRNITTLEREITSLEEKQRALQKANSDQEAIENCDTNLQSKRAELEALKRQKPTQTAQNQGHQAIGEAMKNGRNNGQARAGMITLHELPIEAWRLVIFDHTRHVLGGLISEAYIAPFEQRRQGTNATIKGVLIRFPETPENKALLQELYGESILDGNQGQIYGDIINDGKIEASTNKGKVGTGKAVTSTRRFLAVFAPKDSKLHQYIQRLESEALASRSEEFTNASNAKKIEIATNYRNRAQANLESSEIKQRNIETTIKNLESQKSTLQGDVDKAIAEHGELQSQGATQEALNNKNIELENHKTAQQTNQEKIDRLKADLELEGSYHKGLQALIELEETTIDNLKEAEGQKTTHESNIEEADKKVANERSALEEQRKRQLADAKAELDAKIVDHDAAVKKLNQRSPSYAQLQDNLISSERAVATARAEVATNTANRDRLGKLVDNHAFRGMVLVFQAYNLYSAVNSYKKMMDEQGATYTLFTIGSSIGNVILAVEDIIANATKVHMNFISSALRNKVLYEIPAKFIPTIFKTSTRMFLNLRVTGMVVAQTVLSFVAVGLTAADLWQSICKNEKGIITFAKGLAFVGSLVGLASVFVGGATFLLLNPLGWAALLLTLAAFALIWAFSRTPLEAWLEYGPFSKSPNSYLTDQTEAFYRLVGIYADVQISIDNNPNVKVNDQTQMEKVNVSYKNREAEFNKLKAGQRIRITSQLNGLLNAGKNSLVYNNQFRLKATGFSKEFSDLVRLKLDIIENDLPNGKEYLLDKITDLKLTTQEVIGSTTIRGGRCEWLVESQIMVNYGGKALAFPALRANNDEELNYTQAVTDLYKGANFDRDFIGETHHPFWANETSHRVDPPKAVATETTDDSKLSANVQS